MIYVKLKTWISVNENWKHIFELAERADVDCPQSYTDFADALSKQLPFNN